MRIRYMKIPCIVSGCGKEFWDAVHTWDGPDCHGYQQDPVAYKRAYKFIGWRQ